MNRKNFFVAKSVQHYIDLVAHTCFVPLSLIVFFSFFLSLFRSFEHLMRSALQKECKNSCYSLIPFL